MDGECLNKNTNVLLSVSPLEKKSVCQLFQQQKKPQHLMTFLCLSNLPFAFLHSATVSCYFKQIILFEIICFLKSTIFISQLFKGYSI